MLLKDLLDNLIYNELGNLSIGKPQWSDSKFSYTSLIQCIYMAYLELHKRYPLKKEYVHLLPKANINDYVLDIAHAVSNTGSTQAKYIIDTTLKPFSNNVVKIDAIFDYLGEELDFNTTKMMGDLRIQDYRTLYIKSPDENKPYDLVCRVLPAPIQLEDPSELDTYEIELPHQYTEALLLYAAGRVYINRGAENATNNESAMFFARFEHACMNIEQYGLYDKENTDNCRLSAKGFV